MTCPVVTKICSTCKDPTPKPISEFYLRSNGKLRKNCKVCCSKATNYYKGVTKIFCPRGEGKKITKSQCLPGCNDACKDCEHFTKDLTVDNFDDTGVGTGVQSSAGYAADMASGVGY